MHPEFIFVPVGDSQVPDLMHSAFHLAISTAKHYTLLDATERGVDVMVNISCTQRGCESANLAFLNTCPLVDYEGYLIQFTPLIT